MSDIEVHEALAKETFNATWDVLDKADRTPDDVDRMLELAHASAYHWRIAGTPLNLARAQWMLARVCSAAGHADLATHHAANCLRLTEAGGFGSFDIVAAHEAVARAAVVAGDTSSARTALATAIGLLDDIADANDREVSQADIDDVQNMLDAAAE